MRCFGFEVDSNILGKVESLFVLFKPSLNDEIYKVRQNSLGQVYLVLHYPGQITRAPGPWKPIWNTPNNSLGLLGITVSTMEVLRRRNKNNDPCLESCTHFDEMVLNTHTTIPLDAVPLIKNQTSPCVPQENKWRLLGMN